MKSKVDDKKSRMLIDNNKSKSSMTLRSIFCLKNKSKLKETEKKEDCFVLDYDPDNSLHKISVSKNNTNDEVSFVAEKGQCYCYMQLRRKVEQVIPKTMKALEKVITALDNQSSVSLTKTMPEYREASRELLKTFGEFFKFLKRQ